MSEHESTLERPKDLAVALRQVADGIMNKTKYPLWFCKEINAETTSNATWGRLLYAAADKVEQYEIQNDSYSRLCKQVYGNG